MVIKTLFKICISTTKLLVTIKSLKATSVLQGSHVREKHILRSLSGASSIANKARLLVLSDPHAASCFLDSCGTFY